MSRETDKRKKEKEKGEGKMQVLTVEVVEGSDLIAMDDDGTSDPYVIVLVGKEKFRTKIIRDTLNPC
jgi:Ca2+-dependent lipid-binding protein